jgi:hypothetical protein
VAVREIPETLTTFDTDVFPCLDTELRFFQAELGERYDHGIIVNMLSSSLGLHESAPPYPDAPPAADAPGDDPARILSDALAAWAAGWNLSSNSWFTLRVVIHAAALWALPRGLLYPGEGNWDPGFVEHLWRDWQPFAKLVPLPFEPGPLEIAGWNPTAETRADFLWRARAVLDEHVQRTEESANLTRTPSTMYNELHFRWLARWQLLGETYRTLGSRERASEDQVKKAVHRTADLVSLIRRTATLRAM